MSENCGRCGEPEDEHAPGQRCPVDKPTGQCFPGRYVDGMPHDILCDCAECCVFHKWKADKTATVDGVGTETKCPLCCAVLPAALIESSPCPHRGPGTAANAVHLIPGGGRTRGRPLGSKSGKGYEAAIYRQQNKINRATRKVVIEKIVGAGISELDKTLAPRIPNRPDMPERTIGELKDSALKLLSQQLWNLEGLAEKQGLTELEEQRLLKLLAGFNAALPKSAEMPTAKDPSQMTEEELAEAMKKR